MDKNILIVGGGFVGLTLCAKLLKAQGVSVTILESDIKRLKLLREGKIYVYEPGLEPILVGAQKNKRLKYSNFEASQIYDAVFICVGTAPSIVTENLPENILGLVELVTTCLKKNGLVFLRSTVTIGTTERFAKSIESAGRNDINAYFAPERTAEGVALLELDTLPQIIGPSTNSTSTPATDFLEFIGFKLIYCSDSKSAEFTKLISNSWRDSVFGLSNEIAVMSEIIGVDVIEIIEIANHNYPRASIPVPGPVGGPCLHKDSHILMNSFSNEFKERSILYNARLRNEEIETRIYEVLLRHLNISKIEPEILFLGAAFKGSPKTNDIRNGLTSNLISRIHLDKHPFKISIWDPTLSSADLLNLSHLKIDSLESASPKIVVIGNNSKELLSENALQFLRNLSAKSLIIDPSRIVGSFERISAQVYQLGRRMVGTYHDEK